MRLESSPLNGWRFHKEQEHNNILNLDIAPVYKKGWRRRNLSIYQIYYGTIKKRRLRDAPHEFGCIASTYIR